MSKTIELSAQKRDILGKKVAQLRTEGLAVGNIFSKGKMSLPIQVDYEVMRKVVEQAGFNHPINIKVEDDNHLVLIKTIDRDPKTNRYHHIGFHEVRKDQKVEASVPVELTGTSPAVLAGNIILTLDGTLLVSASPLDLPDHLEVNAELLVNPDDNIQAKDIKLPENVELVDDLDKALFKVEVPRSQVEEVEETSEADAVAETMEASGGQKDDSSSDAE
ncbi:50S ribosomal protein L25 [Candidatus Saccharibacteria bacterium]|nr:50S ribosomal protein L25 [Candidatus Saccharibacteria bacterium]